MKRFSTLVAFFLAACSTAPLSMTRNSLVPSGDLYTCAMRELARLEYTVENTDRESGFIRARKQTSGLGTSLFLGQNHHSAMTIAVFEDPEIGRSTFRVTVGKITEDTWGWGQGSESLGTPTPEGEAEARDLIAACAPDTGELQVP